MTHVASLHMQHSAHASPTYLGSMCARATLSCSTVLRSFLSRTRELVAAPICRTSDVPLLCYCCCIVDSTAAAPPKCLIYLARWRNVTFAAIRDCLPAVSIDGLILNPPTRFFLLEWHQFPAHFLVLPCTAAFGCSNAAHRRVECLDALSPTKPDKSSPLRRLSTAVCGTPTPGAKNLRQASAKRAKSYRHRHRYQCCLRRGGSVRERGPRTPDVVRAPSARCVFGGSGDGRRGGTGNDSGTYCGGGKARPRQWRPGCARSTRLRTITRRCFARDEWLLRRRWWRRRRRRAVGAAGRGTVE